MELYRTAWTLLQQHPFGIGVGGFADHAILDLRYPHNVFLEAGVELGWVPMLLLMVLSGWSLGLLLGILRRSCEWTSCLLVMVVLMSGINALVTGDFNDNRLFFALVLVPFLYRSATREESARRPRPLAPDSPHAIHLASSP
jgi:O-antigen ligase